MWTHLKLAANPPSGFDPQFEKHWDQSFISIIQNWWSGKQRHECVGLRRLDYNFLQNSVGFHFAYMCTCPYKYTYETQTRAPA